ncbi:MAG TPA: gliding motility-associated C-terminal domain-containing protein [Cytophagaceae bacterium]|nr:gliding motility-associated C-terminal domain-containing protein [Cytophagaceae bacterium]
MKYIKLLISGIIFSLICIEGYSQTTIDFTKDFDPSQLTVPASTVNDPLCGGNTGGIIVQGVTENLPGNPTFTYRLQGQGTVQDSVYQVVTTSKGPIYFSNLARGGYNLTISTPVLPAGSQGTKVSYLSTQVITINPIMPISVTGSQVNPKCPSTINGSATLTATDGTQPYTFNWSGLPGGATVSTGTTSTTASGLPLGTYTATATDANGCSQSYVFTITQDLPTVNLQSNPVGPICKASFPPNVLITWTASPGAGWTPNPAGAYSWDNGVTYSNTTTKSQTYTNYLPVPSQKVYFKDINNCPAVAVLDVPIDVFPVFTLSPGGNVCPGQPFTVTANISKCSAIGANCQVSFDGVLQNVGDVDSVFTITAPKTVSVVVTNATGCSSSPQTVNIDTLAKPHITYSVNPSPICPNNSSNITVNFICNPANCTGYQYDFNGNGLTNVPASATATFVSPTVAQTTAFPLQVVSTCTLDTTVVVTVFPNNTKVNAPDTIVCANNLGPNGPVTLTAVGFNSITDWTPIPGIQTTTTVTVLPSANTTYTVSGIDVNGCPRQASQQVISNAQPNVTTPASVTKCSGGPSVTLTASATGTITYDWESSTYTSLFTGNPYIVNPSTNTTFNVVGTDANGCKDTAQVNVVVLARPVIQSSVASPATICAGNTTSIQINPVMPFTANAAGGYSVSNGTTYGNSGTFSGLGPFSSTTTIYTKIRDNQGCISDSVPVTINVNPFSYNATVVNPTCSYNSNGSITITSVSGGTAPYSYSLNNGPVTSFTPPVTFSNLPSNTYPLIVTDASAQACKDSMSFSVITPSPLSLDTLSSNDVKCKGDANGTIPVNVTGGTANFDYFFTDTLGTSVFGNTSNRTPTYSGLAAGNYTIIVRDAKKCMDTVGNVPINQPAIALAAPATSAVNACYGTSTGSITVSSAATGGWGGNVYVMTSAPTQTLAGIPQTISALAAGTYNFTVTDSKGCVVNFSQTVTQNTQIHPMMTALQSDCGVAGGINYAQATGGTSPYTYSLASSGPFGSLPANETGLTVNTTRTLYVLDNLNCPADTTVTVLNKPRAIPIISITAPLCPNQSNGTITIDSTHIKLAGSQPLDYHLYTDASPTVGMGTFTGIAPSASVTFTSLASGKYIMTMSDPNCANYVVDSFRVYTSATNYVVVQAPFTGLNPDYAEMIVPVTPDFTVSSIALASDVNQNTGVAVLYDYTGGTPQIVNGQKQYQMSLDNDISFAWTTLKDTLNGHSYVSFANLSPGPHTIYVKDLNNCQDTILLQVPGKFFIPNLVTPNGDDHNDVFEVVSLPDNSELKVFNRWGDRVYESSNYDNKYDFKGLSDGVYFYDLEFNTGTRFKGWVQVLR